MGMDIQIGPWMAPTKEDGSEFHRIPHLRHKNAPYFEGSWMMPCVNTFGMGHSSWKKFFERNPLMLPVIAMEYPNVLWVGYDDLKAARDALRAHREKYPGIIPAFKASDEAADLAVMEWFHWWIDFALKEFGEDDSAIEVTW